MSSRREFMKTTLASAGIVAWGQTAPLFLSRTAWAAGAAGKPGAKETVLVVVQLTGGNDGLNTVVPYADEGYGKLRKVLKVQKSDLKKIDDHAAASDDVEFVVRELAAVREKQAKI